MFLYRKKCIKEIYIAYIKNMFIYFISSSLYI